MTTIKRFLTVQDIAGEMQYSESTIRRLIREGKIAVVRIPGKRGVRITAEEYERFMGTLS